MTNDNIIDAFVHRLNFDTHNTNDFVFGTKNKCVDVVRICSNSYIGIELMKKKRKKKGKERRNTFGLETFSFLRQP